jgi:hypothetical protein
MKFRHWVFGVPAGTRSVKLSFADQSPNRGIAIHPLINQVTLKKMQPGRN